MKKLIILLTAFVGVAVVTAFIAPKVIDWERYKDEIVSHLSTALGHTISVDGAMYLSIFPYPAFSLAGVRVSNVEGSTESDMLRLKRLDVQVSLLPLFSGKVYVDKIVLIEPDILLEMFPDGETNWQKLISSESPADIGTVPRSPKMSLKDMRIVKGSLSFLDAEKGRLEEVEEISLSVFASTLNGPYKFSGTAKYKNLLVEAASGIAEALGDEQIGVSGTFYLNGLKVSVTARGDTVGAHRIGGKVSLDGATVPEEFLQIVEKVVPISTNISSEFQLFGKSSFSYTDGTLQITSANVRFGNIAATGSARLSLTVPVNLDANISLTRINLDTFLPPRLVSSDSKSVQVEEREEPFFISKMDWPSTIFPDQISGTLNIAVDALLYRSQAIRELEIQIALESTGIHVNELSGLFPGGTDITLFGSLTPKDETVNFAGQVSGASDNFRRFLEWLGVDVTKIPADRLRRVSISSIVDGTHKSGTITDIDLHFDTSRLVGGIAYAMNGGKPGFGIGLYLDQLNLDAYFPDLNARSESSTNGLIGEPNNEGFASVDDGLSKLITLRHWFPFDADFEIELKNLIAGGGPINGLALDGLLQKDTLKIHQAKVADFSGAMAEFSGLVSGLDSDPLLNGGLQFTINKKGPLARVIPALNYVPEHFFKGPISINTKVEGSDDALGMEGMLAVQDSIIEFNGVISDPFGGPEFSISSNWSTADLGSFVEVATNGQGLERLNKFHLNLPLSVDYKFVGDFSEFDLESKIEFNEATLILEGSFTDGARLKFSSEFWHADLQSFLAATIKEQNRFELMPSGPIQGKVDVEGPFDQLKLHGTSKFLDLAIVLKGEVEGLPMGNSYNTDVSISHPNLNKLLEQFGMLSNSKSVELPLSLSATLHIHPDKWLVPDLTLELAQSKIFGAVKIDPLGIQPSAVVELKADRLLVDDFMGLFGVLVADHPNPGPSNKPSGVLGDIGGDVPKLTENPIVTEWMGILDAEFKINANLVKISQYDFEEVYVDASAQNGVFTVREAVGSAFGGEFRANGIFELGAVPGLGVSIKLEGLDLKEILSRTVDNDKLTGEINMEVAINGNGRHGQELISSLNGGIQIENIGDGEISGLNLRRFSDQIGNLNDIGDFVRLAEISFEQGSTTFTDLSGSFSIENGQLTTEDFSLVADGGAGELVGTLDLAALQQNFILTFKLTEHPDLPKFKMLFQGAIDAPTLTFETSEIEQYFLTRGLESVIREATSGSGPNIVREVLGIANDSDELEELSDDVRGIANALIEELINSDGSEGSGEERSSNIPSSTETDQIQGQKPDPFTDLMQRLLSD